MEICILTLIDKLRENYNRILDAICSSCVFYSKPVLVMLVMTALSNQKKSFCWEESECGKYRMCYSIHIIFPSDSNRITWHLWFLTKCIWLIQLPQMGLAFDNDALPFTNIPCSLQHHNQVSHEKKQTFIFSSLNNIHWMFHCLFLAITETPWAALSLLAVHKENAPIVCFWV